MFCLFALAVQPIFSRCVRGLPSVKALAIQDDFELEGPCKDVLTAFTTVRAEAKTCGLELVLSKSKALWAREAAPSSEVVTQILHSGLTLVYGSMESLGALVGHDDVALRKWAISYFRTWSIQRYQCSMRWQSFVSVPSHG